MRSSCSPVRTERRLKPQVIRSCRWAGLVLGCSIATSALAQTIDPDPPVVETATIETPVKDPLQHLNRASFGLGMALDHAVVGPLAHAYVAITPAYARARVDAVITNLGEPRTVLNDLAQGHARRAETATSRFVINSSAGLLGLFDVAGKMGIAHHRSDFGQTLGRYGAGPGAYLYVPLLGPLTVRDAVGRLVDTATDPVSRVGGGHGTTFGTVRQNTSRLNTRVKLDAGLRALDDATDPYASLRSAYLQRRGALVREATGEAEALPDF